MHRGVYRLAEEADQELDAAREAVRRFIRAPESASVIFTRGTTESINLVAQGWAAQRLRPGDEIALTELEHHSNFLPWQRAAQTTGATLRVSPVEAPWQAIGPRTRLVAFSLVSNVLGALLPAERIVKTARAVGAAVVIDGAQAVPHLPIDVGDLGCDFLAFSGHKMLGPMGIGVLWAARQRLDEMEPLLLGSGMVHEVFADRSTFLDAPQKFEAGTPPVAEAVGLRAAAEYLEALGMSEVRSHTQDLAGNAASRLREIRRDRARPGHRPGRGRQLQHRGRASGRRRDLGRPARHLRAGRESLRAAFDASSGRHRNGARQRSRA